jgi:UDP-3-O-[3-hydroxymyristoyl] glucosamine N-acyltransferase
MAVPMTFSQAQIVAALGSLGIEFRVSANFLAGDAFGFKSFKCIEPGGIYFLAAGFSPPRLPPRSILISEEDRPVRDGMVIVVKDAQVSFYKLMASLVAAPTRAGFHATAIIDPAAKVSPDAYIGPYCVLEDCGISAGVQLHSHVVVMSGSQVEENVVVEPHSTIGATGVAWVWDADSNSRVRQPQTGFVRIGRNSFLGSDVSVVRGSINETTVVGDGCVIAHGSKIGHGSSIGDDCHFANNVSIAGSVTLGGGCFLGSGAVVRPNITIAPGVVVGAGAVVVNDVTQEGCVVAGVPARVVKTANRSLAGVPKSRKHEERS